MASFLIHFFGFDDSQFECLSLAYRVDHLSEGDKLFLKSFTITLSFRVECVRSLVLVPTMIGHVGWNTTGIFCSGAKIRVRGGVSGHVEVDGYEATLLLQVALSDLNSIWIEWRDVCPASNGRSDGARRAHCQTD